MLNYKKVRKHKKAFLAMTGFDDTEFQKLLGPFRESWEEYRTTKKKEGRPPGLRSMEDKLFFILFYLKTYPLQEVLAFLFGMSQSRANDWIYKLSKVLHMALAKTGELPERVASNLKERLKDETEETLAIDGTERRRQRPKDAEEQKKFYSGKKKAHTVKNNVIVGVEDRKVKYLSETYEGKKHDKKICDEENPEFPAGINLYQDTGFQGHHPEGVKVHQPKKKPRNGELSDEERENNSLISSIRVVVEHVISGIKRCRIVKDIFRNTKDKVEDLVMELACALHNFRTQCRARTQPATQT